MPVPKRKVSKARRNKRFANKGLKVKAIATCNNCHKPTRPHQVCEHCGFYKGEKIIQTKEDRRVKRGKERKEKQAAAPAETEKTEASE